MTPLLAFVIVLPVILLFALSVWYAHTLRSQWHATLMTLKAKDVFEAKAVLEPRAKAEPAIEQPKEDFIHRIANFYASDPDATKPIPVDF